ncbi:MAG TPA: GAF domain-containing sensor histidine kinase [Puia sp.]|nr:GAF domain-containing sensor histidine kinase [Puia sp.]
MLKFQQMSAFLKPDTIIPANDLDRLAILYKHEILDTPAEQTFDKIAILAAQIFDTSIAFVSFVDKERVFYKANIGPFQDIDVLREHSLCSFAILKDEVTVISDTFEMAGLLENPFVSGEEGIRFYVGAPLKTFDGYNLGTVCAMDSVPHQVSAKQIQMLEYLSSVVMDELEQRQKTKSAIRLQTDLINMVVHDLRQPVTSSLLYLELINGEKNLASIHEMSAKVFGLTHTIHQKLNELLNISQIENGNLQLNIEPQDISGILTQVIQNFDIRARQKKQRIIVIGECSHKLQVDRARVTEIFENLLSNSLKYSHADSEVIILVKKDEKYVTVEFRDQGLGLDQDDMKKLFVKFARLSSIPTGKERSNGLGLSIVKILVELHKGKVWATSRGKNKGSSFFVAFPVTPQ